MKKKLSILFIAATILMMMVITFIPHHHHNGIACIVVEHCEKDKPVDDRDAHPGNDEKTQNKSCVLEASYFAPNINYDFKCKVFPCSNNSHDVHIHLSRLAFPGTDLILNITEHLFSKTDHGERKTFYKSAETNQFHGLRAPPCPLS